MSQKDADLVYSTEYGRMCPKCGKPAGYCVCQKRKQSVAVKGPAKVERSTKGRKGKVVTVITGLPLAASELKNLATLLKQKCGSGGTVKDNTIEIQGDHRDVVIKELLLLGHPAKRSGG